MLAQRIDNALGGMIVTHSQRPNPMCKASQILAEAVSAGQLQHPDDDAFNRQVLAAGAKFMGVGWRLVKQRGKTLPIDAAVALAMALRVLAEGQETTTPSSDVTVSSSQIITA